MRVRGVALSAALLLAACGGAADEGASVGGEWALILDAQGVVFRRGEAEYRRFPFGSPRAQVEAMATQVYGEGAGTRTSNAECGAGPMSFTAYGPIHLNYQHEALAGWRAGRGAMAMTDDGIVPGITRAQLDRQSGVRLIAGSTLAGEFEYATPGGGRIGGVLRGSGDEAVVEVLFAGANCFFR
jgi:hypothetical protein